MCIYVSHQAPLSMGFPRQDYWSGLPFPSPDLPDQGMEPKIVAKVPKTSWDSDGGLRCFLLRC